VSRGGGYSPEQATHVLARFADTREQLAHRLNHLDEAIDLDSAIRPTERQVKHRFARFIILSHSVPVNPQTGKLPDPNLLLITVAELREQGRAKEAHQLSALIRDVRLMIVLSGRMTRSQKPDARAV
jgi:hypothetical protein